MTDRMTAAAFRKRHLGKPRQPKYRNVRTSTGDGITHDSKREAAHWEMLKLLERSGQISELQRQVSFELAQAVVLDGRKRPPLRYVADFVYIDSAGQVVVEDVKGVRTQGYRIKRHLMRAVHGIEVREV